MAKFNFIQNFMQSNKINKIKKIKQSINSNPQNSTNYERLGILYNQQLHLPYLAIRYIKKAIQLNNTKTTYYRSLYNLEKDVNNVTAQIKCLEHIIAEEPSHDALYNQLGELYLKRNHCKDIEHALYCFRFALRMNDEKYNPHYCFNAAKAELFLGHYSRSLNYANIVCNPFDNPAEGIEHCIKLFNRCGLEYYNHDNYSEAQKCFQNALVISKQPTLYYNLARSFESQGKVKKAIHTAKKALKIDPNYKSCREMVNRLKSSKQVKSSQYNKGMTLDYNSNINYSTKLNHLIGLKDVKQAIHTYLNRSVIHKIRRNKPGHGEIHLVLEGNPGTGKSTVAKLLCAILYQKHIIDKPHFVMVHSTQLVYRHYGESAQHVRKAIHHAMGGVLFIDEAYHLMHKENNNSACEDEAVDELLPDIEKYRDKIVVIMAGYTHAMEKFLDKSNPGLGSRFPDRIKFPNYTNQECIQIMKKYLNDNHFLINTLSTKKLLNNELTGYLMADRSNSHHVFSNARTVRDVYTRITDAFANRLMNKYTRLQLLSFKKSKYKVLNTLTSDDVKNGFRRYEDNRSSQSAAQKLHDLVGLKHVKSIITTAINQVLIHKIKTGNPQHDLMNMAFEGNPGTGKTTVAKLFCQILYEKGITKSSNYVYISAASLTGELVGESAKKLRKAVNQAMNGVLFIDEAYELANDNNQSIISQLISDVSKYKNKLVIILAGYPKLMEELLTKTNVGLSSRFPDRVYFPDYSMKECQEILLYDFNHANLKIKSRQVRQLLVKSFDCYIKKMHSSQNKFANARTVNNYFRTLKRSFANRLCSLSVSDLKNLKDCHSDILNTINVQDIKDTSYNLQNIIRHLGTPSIGFQAAGYHSNLSLNN